MPKTATKKATAEKKGGSCKKKASKK